MVGSLESDLRLMHSVDFQEDLTLEDGTKVDGFIEQETVKDEVGSYTQTYTILRSFREYLPGTIIMRGDERCEVAEATENEGAWKHYLREADA